MTCKHPIEDLEVICDQVECTKCDKSFELQDLIRFKIEQAGGNHEKTH